MASFKNHFRPDASWPSWCKFETSKSEGLVCRCHVSKLPSTNTKTDHMCVKGCFTTQGTDVVMADSLCSISGRCPANILCIVLKELLFKNAELHDSFSSVMAASLMKEQIYIWNITCWNTMNCPSIHIDWFYGDFLLSSINTAVGNGQECSDRKGLQVVLNKPDLPVKTLRAIFFSVTLDNVRNVSDHTFPEHVWILLWPLGIVHRERKLWNTFASLALVFIEDL